jgi:nitroreductase
MAHAPRPQQIDPTRRSVDLAPAETARKRELIRSATLAANGHNTQPWRFSIAENAIVIHPDYARRLPLEPGVVLQVVTDPADRERVLEYVNQGNLANTRIWRLLMN